MEAELSPPNSVDSGDELAAPMEVRFDRSRGNSHRDSRGRTSVD
jgi:hypothetical protein